MQFSVTHRTMRCLVVLALSLVACKDQPAAPLKPETVTTEPGGQLGHGHPSIDPALPPGHPPVPRYEFGDTPGHPAMPTVMPTVMPTMPATAVQEVLPLQWDDPAGWRREAPANGMRKAQYQIARVGTDARDAEMTVITFGAGSGGDVEANIQRWIGQLSQPDGSPSASHAKREQLNVGPFRISMVEVAGQMGASTTPGMPMPAPAPGSTRLIASVVEAPSGSWFFKLVGPDQTVASAREGFMQMMKSLRESSTQRAAAVSTDAATEVDGGLPAPRDAGSQSDAH